MIKKGTWVSIEKIVLEAKDRADNLPEDTKKTDLKQWVKGYLEEDATIGDMVKVKTITDREEEGKLIEATPYYEINYGKFVGELLTISTQVKEILHGGDQ